MNKSLLIILVVLIVAGSSLGYYLGYQKGWQTAEEKVSQSGIFSEEETEELFTIRGEISEIDGQIIYLKGVSVITNPLEREGPTERKVLVTDQTKIVKQIEKTPEEIDEEMIETLAETGEDLPPEPFKEISISLADLKVGDRISVRAKENIKYKEEFEATNIIFSVEIL